MRDETELVRARIDIVQLIGERVALKRSGKNWTGLCPFHEDRRPSFTVSPSLGVYRCWACGAKGDIFTWVMETQKVDFPEALALLAKRAGVTLSRTSRSGSTAERGRRERVMEAALGFFRRELERSDRARAYCESRGLTAEVIAEWELGYAPDHPEALTAFLRKAGYRLAEGAELSLIAGDETAGYRDRFRDRLMFPIRDELGRLVGFGGRALGTAGAKYVNSAETPLFRKGQVLYGLHRAKEHIVARDRVVLVEGYLDVIACHRAGLSDAVAPLGTALTEDHGRALARLCKRAVVLFDSDQAGQAAAARAEEVLRAAGLAVRFASLAAGEDPDSVSRKEGPEMVRRAVEESAPPVDFRMARLRERSDPEDPEFWAEAIRILAREANPLEVERYVVELSGRYPGLRDPVAAQKVLAREIARHRAASSRARSTSPALQAAVAAPTMSSLERIVFLGALREDLREAAWPSACDPDLFVSRPAVEIARALAALGPAPPGGEPALWLGRIEDEEARQALIDLALKADRVVSREELVGACTRLEVKRQRREAQRLRREGPSDPDERLRAVQERLRRVHELESELRAAEPEPRSET